MARMPRPLLAATLLAAMLAAQLAVPAAAQPRAGCFTEAVVRQLTRSSQADPSCAVLRPGVEVTVRTDEGDQRCMTSYLFHGSDGMRYLGTDGYCVLPGDSDDRPDGWVVYPKGKGFAVLFGGKRVGEVRYAAYEAASTFSSFALIRLDRKAAASPSIRGWGGPTGIDRRVTTTPEQVLLTAQFAQHEAVAARGLYDRTAFDGVAPVALLGNGGAVLAADGKAIGVLTGVSFTGAKVERIEPLVQKLASRLKIRLRLGTARFAG